MNQPPYPGYPPQPTSGGYATGWDQSTTLANQQTAQGGGYDMHIALTEQELTTFMPLPSAATFLAVKTKLKGHQKRITGFSFSNALNVLVSSGADSQGRVASEIKHVKPRLTSQVSVAQEKRDMISEASKGSRTKPRVRVNDIPVRSKAEKKTPDRVAQNKCSMLKMPNYEEEAELEEDERSDEESEEESGEEVEAEERVKSLCVENQIWRDLAQTNEATANTLRCNLKEVLA
ncbi:WD repeat domain-containing protein [Forsythia ovata]|uniref:WD repeat domain-containing protein n=1 Tax=Forsythia ovata TaxID=205694 RepID=A0ABD1UEA2_9LAMI